MIAVDISIAYGSAGHSLAKLECRYRSHHEPVEKAVENLARCARSCVHRARMCVRVPTYAPVCASERVARAVLHRVVEKPGGHGGNAPLLPRDMPSEIYVKIQEASILNCLIPLSVNTCLNI